jgi:hypothetical protein|tara:strand:+ start:259 stop:522 length:264 start_codon:yes stop_codon:yes gene_type:complete
MKTNFLILDNLILNFNQIKKVEKQHHPKNGTLNESNNITITYSEINYKGEEAQNQHYSNFDKKTDADKYWSDIAKQINELQLTTSKD